VAQHSNEHLTIAQLSAYVDRELAPDEQALCDAHLRTCQLCRSALADLQLTSALLRGMPRERAPRSFVLPLNIAVLPETPTHEDQPGRRPARRQYVLRRSLRTLSTLAAVIGLVFILIGAISALPHGGVANMSTASSGVPAAASARHPTSTSSASGTRPSLQDANAASTVGKTPTPAPSPVVTQTPSYASLNHTAAPPPAVLDLGRPEGRLGIGSALFLLGLLGVILARRHQHNE